MKVQLICNMWFDVIKDGDGDIIISTSGDNGNEVEIVIKKKDSRFIKTLIKDLQNQSNK